MEPKKRNTRKPKAVEPITKTKAEELCEGLSSDLKAQAVTLANAVLTMQTKIEQQIPVYREEPLAQTVVQGNGETVLRQNPITQEFRATVRDYASALNNLSEILEKKEAEKEESSLDALKSRFKVG